jgi:hypothetical protein
MCIFICIEIRVRRNEGNDEKREEEENEER